jgi:hypothetical protein
MSSLLCGSFEFARALDEREQGHLGFSIVDLAQRERFGVQLGCAIVQPLVFEILGRGRAFAGESLPFLITDSPIWDVSERVIDRYSPDYPDAEPDGTLAERLSRLQRFFADALKIEPITQIKAVFTVGYSPTYPEERLSADRFIERMEQLYEGVAEVPSVKLTLVR